MTIKFNRDSKFTNYPANVVSCKLWGLTGSPTESILALALFNKLAPSRHPGVSVHRNRGGAEQRGGGAGDRRVHRRPGEGNGVALVSRSRHRS